jgi:two-component system, response regulator / RNA-binding antiterminator
VNSSLSILVIDENRERSSLIEDSLREAGHDRVIVIDRVHSLLKRIEDIAPDVIVIDLGNADRDLLEHMFLISRTVRRPIAMFVDKSDEQAMYQAVEAGVSAYVVDGLKKDRVKSVLDLAVIRFKAFEKLRTERDDATQALAERKEIDRAKGIVMKMRNIGEDEAYRLLRQTAMNQKKTIAEIARAIIASSDIMLEP